ncbi:hypothetical protein GCM10007063_15260 [Lentibacillus kapialis]|uniref:Uncharacterized protein n=1 Tax=Lentibacillus kapialis TaxID=340214 RepID=A0A917UX40_9BACI|nr:hypothetical protein [Lentibacillus kapialis]GGJ93655.1 hypothetical protein GCM10007063_15260 [Lentibacillus kapialis]
MERVHGIIQAADFNFALTNLLIDLYSTDYVKYFDELNFEEQKIDNLSESDRDKLTKVAAVIEYVGNRQKHATLPNWIYSAKLKLDTPYTPGVESASIARIKRIITAPKEFASRNVFYNEDTLEPV